MRKLLVKIFNLIYIAAAGISIYALCTRPILNAKINVNLSKEKMGEIVSKAFNKNSSSSSESEESESRFTYRDSKKMGDYITPEKVQSYFPDGYKLEVPLQITVDKAFNLKNTKVLDQLLEENLYRVIDNVTKSLIEPVQGLFKDIVKGYAIDTLTSEINKQIAEKFPDGDLASEEEINKVFEDVYSLLDDGEPVSVNTLADTILNGSDGQSGVLDIINSRGAKYVPYAEQPSSEQVEADRTAEEAEWKYYVESISYIHNENEFNSSTTYFKKISETEFVAWDEAPTAEDVEADRTAEEAEWKYYVEKKSYSHNTEAYDAGTTYFEKQPYSNEDINKDQITDQMIASLEGVEGLVTKIPHKVEPKPDEATVTADINREDQSKRIYYISDGNGDYVLPEAYDPNPEVDYYTIEKVVNDIDTAMNTLIDSFLNGSSSGSNDGRAVVREESLKSSEDLEATIKAYLMKMIPENVSSVTGSVGAYAPYILLGLVVLFALPWAWFAFVTLIRTFRKDKCWTRPGIVIWGALLQVILGIVLTYGTKYLWPYVAQRVDALKDFANAINFDIRTGCLIPSFVYLGVFVMTIPYMILGAPLKRRWKQMKRISRSYR